MTSIHIYVLNTPQIIINSTPCILPYRKAEALFFYLAIEKKVTRDQAAALLWDSCDEATAKKNLRHAIYTIKKVTGFELILSDSRHMLKLNPDLNISVDYEDFIGKGLPSDYQVELLKGFYVKNALPYEEWLLTKRSLVLDLYLQNLYDRLLSLPPSGVGEAEQLFKLYLLSDALDERVYRLMLELYEKNGLFYKGIKLYRRQLKHFEKELGTTPGKETNLIYKRLMQTWSDNTAAVSKSPLREIQGREEEMKCLSEAFRRFVNGEPTALILSGENGSGKTYLAEYFLTSLADESCLILRTSCMETEQAILLQPWNSIMLQLEQYIKSHDLKLEDRYLEAVSCLFPMFGSIDLSQFYLEDASISYSYRSTRNLLLKLFFTLSEQVSIVFFFDNLNYMDSISLDFMSLLIRSFNPNIMFLGTCGAALSGSLKTVLSPLIKEKHLTRISLSPFLADEEEPLPKQSGPRTFRQRILNKLMLLSRGERQILDLLSTCQSHAALAVFADVLGNDPLELLSILETLKEKEFIYEKTEGKNICFSFRNNTTRKLVYSEMSPSKRKLFHERLAENLILLEGFGPTQYECLIYHYFQSGNEALELKYRILILEEYINRNYELYPMQYMVRGKIEGGINSLPDYCGGLEDRLLSLDETESATIDIAPLYLSLLHSKAQYCIAQGEYEKGLESLDKALKLNEQYKKDPLIRIRCLRLRNFHQLNIWKLQDLELTLSECLSLAQNNHFEEEYAIDCRLYGLYFAMKGDFERSFLYLNRAVSGFSGYPLKSRVYALNIAACYNYMGENYRKQKDFRKAVELYRKAIKICDTSHCMSNPVFYSNLGRAFLAMGQKTDSSAAFYTSEQIYNESAALIGRSITKGYVSILEAEKGNFAFACSLINEAAETAAQLASPHSLGLLALNRYTLLKRFPRELSDCLTKTPEEYLREAVRYLDGFPGIYEIEEPELLY